MAFLVFIDGLFEDKERRNDDEDGSEDRMAAVIGSVCASVVARGGVHATLWFGTKISSSRPPQLEKKKAG